MTSWLDRPDRIEEQKHIAQVVIDTTDKDVSGTKSGGSGTLILDDANETRLATRLAT